MKYYLVVKLAAPPKDAYEAAKEFAKLFNIDFTVPLIKYKSTEMLYPRPIDLENKEDFAHAFIKYPFFEFITLEELLVRASGT